LTVLVEVADLLPKQLISALPCQAKQQDGASASEVHPAAWKLAEHIRGVFRAATAIPTGIPSDLHCPPNGDPVTAKCPAGYA
jgi:hypothetical protein